MHTMWGQIQQWDSSVNLFDRDDPSVENHSTTVHSASGRHSHTAWKEPHRPGVRSNPQIVSYVKIQMLTMCVIKYILVKIEDKKW